jgi:hypothetical protein
MINPFGTPKSNHQPHHQSNSPDLFKILESRDLQKKQGKNDEFPGIFRGF